jgi:FkbM family methyltransferase
VSRTSGATVEAVDTYRKGQMHPVEQERQICIFGNELRLIGTQGDLYFEAHVSDNADRDIMSVLAAAISDGDLVLDIGANIGFVSLVMSMLSPKGSVFAFEPAHVTRGLLEKNVKLNERQNITISDAALSDSEGLSTLNYRQWNSSGSFVSESAAFEDMDDMVRDRIRLSRLDDEYQSLGIASCSLMKIDVEGHEPNVLRGATAFIKKFEPLAVMEVNHFCLNVINRTSLPEFIELTFCHFPYVFAFHESDYFELHDADSKWRFFVENCANNAYQNVFCGFDRVDMIRRLNVAFGAFDEARRLTAEAQQLRSEKAALEMRVNELGHELSSLRSSRPLLAAGKINKLLGR